MSFINSLPMHVLKEVTSYLGNEQDVVFKELSLQKACFGTIHESLEIANLIKDLPLRKATLEVLSNLFYARVSRLAPFSDVHGFKASLRGAQLIPVHYERVKAIGTIFTNALQSLGLGVALEMVGEIPRDQKHTPLLGKISEKMVSLHLDSAIEIARSMPNLADNNLPMDPYLYIAREEQGYFHGIHWGWESVGSGHKNAALDRCCDRLVELEDIDRALEVVSEITAPARRELQYRNIIDKLIEMNQIERAIPIAMSIVDVFNRNFAFLHIGRKFAGSGDANRVIEFFNLIDDTEELHFSRLPYGRDRRFEEASQAVFNKGNIDGSIQIGMQISKADIRDDLFLKLARQLARAQNVEKAREIALKIEDEEMRELVMRRIV